MTRKLSIAIMLTFGFGSPVLSDTVSSAQRILNELGYNAGTVDGSYGNRTKRALESFYVDNNSLYDGKLDDNEIADLKLAAEKAHDASKLILDTIVREPFKASKCRDVFEGNVRLHSKSDCFVLAELDHPYEVPVHQGATNIWNTMMMLDAQPTMTGGVSLHAYTFDQTVEFGTDSEIRPKTHLVTVEIKDPSLLQDGLNIAAKEWEFALVPRRLSFRDIDLDGDIELLLLANQEDGRLRLKNGSSWRDKNYIFSPSRNTLKSFGTPQFSHDLMTSDFDQDGHIEVMDHYYGVPGKRSGLEHCNLKTSKCKHYFINKLLDNGFTAFAQNGAGGMMFGPCAGKAGLELCWLDVRSDKGKLKFIKIAKHKIGERPQDKTKFLTWTGNIDYKQGTFENDTKTIFNLLDRPWISHMTDFDGDGDKDTLAFDVKVKCEKPKNQKYFDRTKDCKRKANALFFENIEGKDIKLSQTIPVDYNGQNKLLTGDVNRDGSADIYGYRDQWHVNDCNKQFTMVFLNDGNNGYKLMKKEELVNNFGKYGCENGSIFFEHNDVNYRLFTTQKVAGPSKAFLAIEVFSRY
jgi:hypothetical protein